MDIPEKDWKIIRSLKDEALDLTCQRILEKASKIIEANDKKAHAKYLDLYKFIDNEDGEIGHRFNDLKRRNAIMEFSLWVFYDLVSAKDVESLSKETQERVQSFVKSYNEEK